MAPWTLSHYFRRIQYQYILKGLKMNIKLSLTWQYIPWRFPVQFSPWRWCLTRWNTGMSLCNVPASWLGPSRSLSSPPPQGQTHSCPGSCWGLGTWSGSSARWPGSRPLQRSFRKTRCHKYKACLVSISGVHICLL